MKTINDILIQYKVKKYRWTNAGLIAINKRSQSLWLYFRWDIITKEYNQTGSTIHFEE